MADPTYPGINEFGAAGAYDAAVAKQAAGGVIDEFGPTGSYDAAVAAQANAGVIDEFGPTGAYDAAVQRQAAGGVIDEFGPTGAYDAAVAAQSGGIDEFGPTGAYDAAVARQSEGIDEFGPAGAYDAAVAAQSGYDDFGPNFDKSIETQSAASSAADPSATRLASAGLTPTGAADSGKTASINWTGANADPGDWRVKVSVAPGSGVLYDLDGMTFLNPIKSTGGVVFPITPQIQMTYTAKYSSASLTHSNYAMHFYEGSEIGSIQINGEFPVQNIQEGQYLLAAIYFFRAATKMYWGNDVYAGTPPPMVYLTGYGAHYFPTVPCVITQFMHTMPEDKDFIEIPAPGQKSGPTTRLPTQSTLQLQLQPIYSRKAITEFNVDLFANGEMITGNGFRGGFI